MSDESGRVAISSGDLSATIDPLGAQLYMLQDRDGRDLLWDGDPAFWTGRAPILFPIVGMLNHDRYRLDGVDHEMAKHGFARRKLFEVAEASPGLARFRLTADAQTRAVYPFEFELDLTFEIAGPTLIMTATVGNPGAAPLPASFGFHPALRWPLPYGRPREEHALVFPHPEPGPIRRINADGLLTEERHYSPVHGDTLTLRDDLFTHDAVIFDSLESQSLAYGAADGPRLEITFPDTELLGVWTKPGAGYICVEPWHGIADPVGYDGDFRDKPGVFEVAPGEEKVMRMTITLTV